MDTLALLREECNRALDFQMTWVDALDTKAGLILGAVLIVSGIIFSGDFVAELIAHIVLIASLLLSCGGSLVCLYVRTYERPPNPDLLWTKYYAGKPSTVQRVLVATAAEAWLINQGVIHGKVQWLKVAMISLAAAFMMIIVNGQDEVSNMNTANEANQEKQPLSQHTLPPQDLDAEQATLGAMLVAEEAASLAFGIVEAADFYRQAHRLILAAMKQVADRNEPVDLITVGVELRRNEQLEEVGGGEYLTALINQVPTAADITRYATIVAEKSVLRKLITAGSEIQAMAHENPDDVGSVLNRARSRILNLSQDEGTTQDEGPPQADPDLRVQVEKGVPEASKRKQKRSRTKDNED